MTPSALPRPRAFPSRFGRVRLGLALVLPALFGLALLAGCTGGSSASKSAASAGLHNAAAPAAGASSAASSGAADAAAALPAAGGAVNTAAAPPVDFPSGPALIKTAALSLTVASVDPAATKADQLAVGLGGSVAQDNRTGTGNDETADLQLKVPPAQLTTALTDLKALGVLVSQNSSTTDATKQVADVDSRVASMKAAISQLQSIYAQAKTVGEILSVESTLTSREANLESLEAQQSALAAQTSQASISMHLSVAQKATVTVKKTHPDSGFAGGLHRGWHAFTAASTGVVIAIGAVLPFLVVVLVLGLIAWLIRKRLRKAPQES
jgi:hypothetical protein